MNTPDTPAKPKKPKPAQPSATDVLELFRSNLNLIREYYRAKDRGPEVTGLYVLLEITTADTLAALDSALQGKAWAPPQ